MANPVPLRVDPYKPALHVPKSEPSVLRMESKSLEQKTQTRSGFAIQGSTAAMHVPASSFVVNSAANFVKSEQKEVKPFAFSPLAANAPKVTSKQENELCQAVQTADNGEQPLNASISSFSEDRKLNTSESSPASLHESRQNLLTPKFKLATSTISSPFINIPGSSKSVPTAPTVVSSSGESGETRFPSSGGQSSLFGTVVASTANPPPESAHVDEKVKQSTQGVFGVKLPEASFDLSKGFAVTPFTSLKTTGGFSTVVSQPMGREPSSEAKSAVGSAAVTSKSTYPTTAVFGSQSTPSISEQLVERKAADKSTSLFGTALFGSQSSTQSTTAKTPLFNINAVERTGGLFGKPTAPAAVFGSEIASGASSLSAAVKETVTTATTATVSPFLGKLVASNESAASTEITKEVTTTVHGPLTTSHVVGQLATSVTSIPSSGKKTEGGSLGAFVSKATISPPSYSVSQSVPTEAPKSSLKPKDSTDAPILLGTSATSSASLFGAKTSPSSTGLSGAAVPPSKPSIFGVSSTGTAIPFGNKPSGSSTGVFATQSTSGAPSLFNVTAQTSLPASGLFATSISSSSNPSVFGAKASSASSFGQSPASAPSLFGSQQPPQATGVFGSQPTQVKSTGLFGTPAASQSTGGIFGSNKSTSAGGIFGSSTSNQTAFGQTTPAFGSQPSSSSSSGMYK